MRALRSQAQTSIIFNYDSNNSYQHQEPTRIIDEYYECILKENRLTSIIKEIKEFSILEEMTLDYILKNFSIKMIDIINDFVTLFNMRCTIDCPNNESKFGKYIFYIKEIAKILTKDERLFFVGLLFLVIGILMNFVNLSN